MQNILLVDDDKDIHDIIGEGLSDFEILHAYTGKDALEILSKKEINAAICDLVLPDLSGLDLIREIKKSYDIPIIMITGYASIESAIESIKSGADDYLKKPFSIVEVDSKLKRILKHYSVINENLKLKTLLSGTPEGLGIVYTSQKMDNIMQLVKRIASYRINVLIQGESGVGKEVIARAIHKLSSRENSKFIAINCSGIPETLLESELFGYIKGAFTGAIGNKKGLVEEANQGTLFLDEIGDASPEFQVKVLRMIDTGTYTPIGSTSTKQVDVRFISATNKDIKWLIEKGHQGRSVL
ncbi:MAG: response regulator [Proteobacteria bacterium]|nr:response regulator [Pseudomonadota bacterium]